MKRLQVYSNVNPLEPNTFLEVWCSDCCGSTRESDWWNIAREEGRKLISKGYGAYIKETIQQIYDL